MKNKISTKCILMITSLLVASMMSTIIATADEYGTLVLYTQESTFTVSIPKKLDIVKDVDTEYSVTVQGDICANQYIDATPENTFILMDADGKPSVQCEVSQDKTIFAYDEINSPEGCTTHGVIRNSGLSAGNWSGTLRFDITVKDLTDIDINSENVSLYNISPTGDMVIPTIVSDTNGVKYRVTQISADGFKSNLDITTVSLPASIKFINDGAFKYCDNLTDVCLQYGIESIGSYAFYMCPNLKTITLPDSITSIGDRAFRQCYNLTNVTLPSGLTAISDCTFSECTSMTSIVIPVGVTSIGWEAFHQCEALQSVTLPDSIQSINMDAFSGCINLKEVTYMETAYTTEEALLEALTSNGVSVGDSAFSCLSND